MEISLYIFAILGLTFHQVWKIKHRKSTLRDLSFKKWAKDNWFNVGLGITVTIALIATSLQGDLELGSFNIEPTYFNSFMLGWFSDSVLKKVGKEVGFCPIK